MKNKIIVLVIMLLGVFVFATKDVFAEEAKNRIAWEKTETWNYPATVEITGIDLYVYNHTINETDEDADEESDKYMKFNPDKKISLDLEKYNLNLTKRNDTMNKYPATLVDLGLDITKEDLEEILQEEMNSANDEKSYYVEMVVNYKLISSPEEYTYRYEINLAREMINILSGKTSEPVSVDDNYKQVFNIITISYDEESGKNLLYYETEITEENGLSTWVFNYLIFTKQTISVNEKAPDDSYIILFHNVDNVDYLIENVANIEENAEEGVKESEIFEKPKSEDQVVSVPNTAKNATIFIGVMGLIALILGGVIIGSVLIKRKPIGI